MRDPIYTVGHSTQTAEAFGRLLEKHGIRQLADVRLIPKSARYPHFAREPLAAFLERRGIAYQHFVDLGGRRKPLPDSVNTAWRVEGFRGYADYMRTARFRQAIDRLLAFASQARTSVMCAEAVWWQCHRRLLADALLVRGVPVLHILASGAAGPHELSEFAREVEGELIYPGLLGQAP
ncbi:MAG TPA: DUF488 domain-containing protein [Vicinamibacterales bacterium]|nr:DUF488 domain-containing protein [Vicinamibacterales bacterium]